MFPLISLFLFDQHPHPKLWEISCDTKRKTQYNLNWKPQEPHWYFTETQQLYRNDWCPWCERAKGHDAALGCLWPPLDTKHILTHAGSTYVCESPTRNLARTHTHIRWLFWQLLLRSRWANGLCCTVCSVCTLWYYNDPLVLSIHGKERLGKQTYFVIITDCGTSGLSYFSDMFLYTSRIVSGARRQEKIEDYSFSYEFSGVSDFYS